jgi:D-alanyl-D-alanine carboxypeptidase/D-alanyl-D-alanine-endopeptidase (penicillin-binding protein 4)
MKTNIVLRRFAAAPHFILAGLLLTAAWLASFPGFAQQPAPTTAPASLAELQQRLSEHVQHPRFAAGSFGVKVVSLETGKTLFENDAAKLLSPASNCKLYTMALALDKLGGDYRIKTSLYAEAKPDQRGNLKGDLIVYGRGDPGFNVKAGGGDIFRALQPLVAALTNAGVRQISGDLIGEDSFIVGAPLGSGWAWDDMNYYYGAEISALTINDNTLQVSVKPGAKAGAPCQLTISPATSYVVLSNRTQTIAAAGRRDINFYRPLGQNVIYVTGQMPLDQTNYTDDVTFSNPAGLFVALFKEALARHGVKVSGTTRTMNWLDRQGQTLDPGKLVELGAVQSKTMRELNVAVQKPSQNLYTDLMLAHVGSLERERVQAERSARNTNAAIETVVGTTSSEDYGIRELDKFLTKAGVKRGEVRFEEGSGLSRNNVATPNATIALLEYMSRHAEAKSYHDALPIAGKDGTLRNRLKGTRAEGNVHAKTGTLRWANSTSGYVTTAAGEKLAFCLMLNRYAAPAPEFSARAELDKVIVQLADFTGRSDQ